MKSLTAVCQTGASMPAIKPNGRISRHPHHRGDGENAEMKMYLSKLKDLVPFMPKNRKLSKLEIIQHVIDYICDLQTELEAHPEINNFDAAAALNFAAVAANDNRDTTTTTTLTAAALVAINNNNNNVDNDVDDDDVDDDDDDEEIQDEDLLTERLAADVQQQMQQQQQQQQLSSPAIRQPLVDRQAPNTILPASNNLHSSAAQMHLQQQQLQQLQEQQQQQILQLQQQQQLILQQQLQQLNNLQAQTMSASAEKDSRPLC